MSLASAPVATPQELVGKKLGIQQSGVPIYDAFFNSIDIDPKSITYVPVQFDPAPLVNGEVDAFVSFQTNQPIQLKTQGIETVTFLPADYGFNLFSDAFIVSEDTLNNPEARATVVKSSAPASRAGRMPSPTPRARPNSSSRSTDNRSTWT